MVAESAAAKFISKYWPFAIILLSGFLIYFHYLGFAFLPYDDNLNIYENKHLLGGDWVYFWRHSHVNFYVPVTYTAWTWTYLLAGLDSAGFHLLNVLVHLANVMLVYLIFNKLSFSKPAALVGAMLFMLHPLQVESVAWVTGLKDTLSFFFVLLSVWFFLADRRILSVALFYLALLAKPSVVALPVFLACLAFSKTSGLVLAERVKIFFRNEKVLLLAFLGIIPTIYYSQMSQQAEVNLDAVVSFSERVAIVFDTLGFYIQKIILPTGLYPDYGRTPRLILHNRDYFLNISTCLVFFAGLILFLKIKVCKLNQSENFIFWFFTVFAFCLYLPISGVVSFGYQSHSTTADRYMYPVLFSVAGLLSFIYDKYVAKNIKIIYKLIIGTYFFMLAVIGYQQSLNWENTGSYYEFAYEGAPAVYKYANNIAVKYQNEGQIGKSNELFYKAMEIDPQRLPPISGIVLNLYNQKKYDELEEFGKKHLQTSQLKKMVPSVEALVLIYRSFAMERLERNRPEKALPLFCLAEPIVAKPRDEFDKLLADTRNAVSEKNRYCPQSIDQLDREIF